jgi:hypothetical protein
MSKASLTMPNCLKLGNFLIVSYLIYICMVWTATVHGINLTLTLSEYGSDGEVENTKDQVRDLGPNF